MANIDITRMSSKGQIVIPVEMRKDFHEGERFVIIQAGKQLILKQVEYFDENIEEELEFARRTEEAWQEIEKGKGISMDFNDFMKEIKRW
jgi:bifunctional DNA-binding transcriptional regulator/antitoxin component of YhaV-PrlF toxin-antitoxin module